LRELKTPLETQKARLRVRITQLRRLRALAQRRTTNTAYRRQGIGCLSGKPSRSNGIKPLSAEDVRSFWSGVVGVESHFDLSEPAIRELCGTYRGAFPSAVEDWPDCQLWGLVVRKLKGTWQRWFLWLLVEEIPPGSGDTEENHVRVNGV